MAGNDVWAAGTDSSGGALLLHYDGAHWARSPVPPLTSGGAPVQSAALNGLTAASATDAWAVGSQVTSSNRTIPLTLHWDGSAWSQVATPDPVPGGSFAQLASVSASSPADAWAVGVTGHGFGFSTLTMHWDGAGWTIVPSPNPGSAISAVVSVVALSANSAVAVGNYTNGLSPIINQQLVLRWDGTSWTQVTVSNPAGGQASLSGVAAGPAGLWAAGESASTTSSPAWRASAAMFGTVVPNVVNDTDAAARTAITEAGLTVGPVTSVANCDVPRGIVLSQNPSAGGTAVLGALVSLTESTGRAIGGRPCI